MEEQYGPDRTILTLAFIEKQAEKTSGKDKRKKQAETAKENSQSVKTIGNKRLILAFIAKNGSAGSASIAEYIGLSQARTRVLLSELVDDEKIKPCGNGRARKYISISAGNNIQQ